MARFDQLENMYDVGLKPVMLRSLIRQCLPAENHHLNLNNSCFELPSLVSILQTHRLLSELDSQSIDPKLINTWKSAVDDWLSCLLSLLSSDMVCFNSFFWVFKCYPFSCLKWMTCDYLTFFFSLKINYCSSSELWVMKHLSVIFSFWCVVSVFESWRIKIWDSFYCWKKKKCNLALFWFILVNDKIGTLPKFSLLPPIVFYSILCKFL